MRAWSKAQSDDLCTGNEMVSINNDLSKVERIIRTCYRWAIKTYIANLKIQDFLGLGFETYMFKFKFGSVFLATRPIRIPSKQVIVGIILT